MLKYGYDGEMCIRLKILDLVLFFLEVGHYMQVRVCTGSVIAAVLAFLTFTWGRVYVEECLCETVGERER